MRLIDSLVIAYARSPSHPAKLRLLDMALSRVGKVNVRTANGAVFRINGRDHIGRNILVHDSYEPRTLALARRLTEGKGKVFLDIGSNLGLFAVNLARNADLRVIAVEPDPENFLELRTNIVLNGLANVTPCNVALGAETGFITLELPMEGNRGMTRVRQNGVSAIDGRHACLTVRQLCEWLKLDRIDLLKMDVEGFEYSVLKGMDFDGRLRPRNLVIEHNGLADHYDQGGGSVFEFMAARDYEALDISGSPAQETNQLDESNVWFRCRRSQVPT